VKNNSGYYNGGYFSQEQYLISILQTAYNKAFGNKSCAIKRPMADKEIKKGRNH